MASERTLRSCFVVCFLLLALTAFIAQAQHEPFSNQNFDPLSGMSQDQVKHVFRSIFKKIDVDGSKQLNEEELTIWARRVSAHSALKNTEERWRSLGLGDGDTLPWEKYKVASFGEDFMDGDENQDDKILIDQLTERDRLKWDDADADRDHVLTKEEFAAFLHPENFDHMRNTIIAATYNDMDLDKDGRVTEDEFIGEVRQADEAADKYDWSAEQRRQFREVHDLNKDGLLDQDEVRVWLNPFGYSAAGAEAKHVLYSCDADHDGELTLTELLNQPEAFARTMLADYGSALQYHDEL